MNCRLLNIILLSFESCLSLVDSYYKERYSDLYALINNKLILGYFCFRIKFYLDNFQCLEYIILVISETGILVFSINTDYAISCVASCFIL